MIANYWGGTFELIEVLDYGYGYVSSKHYRTSIAYEFLS